MRCTDSPPSAESADRNTATSAAQVTRARGRARAPQEANPEAIKALVGDLVRTVPVSDAAPAALRTLARLLGCQAAVEALRTVEQSTSAPDEDPACHPSGHPTTIIPS